eukprot:Clim_evm34s109 gene=Clim_evmTU34s109
MRNQLYEEVLALVRQRAAEAKSHPDLCSEAVKLLEAKALDGNQDTNSGGKRRERSPDSGQLEADSDGKRSKSTEDILIPSETVGYVIGRGGETIRMIEVRSGAWVKVAPDEGQPKRTITLSGRLEAIAKAKELIDSTMDEFRRNKEVPQEQSNEQPSMDQQNGAGVESSGEVSETIEVPMRLVGLIIGRGGEKIREIQDRSRCNIQVQQTGLPPGATTKPVIITGKSHDDVSRAKQIIDEAIDEDTGPRGMNRVGSRSTAGSVEMGGYGEVTYEMPIPVHAAGMVIGKGGDTIRRLEQQSGAKMRMGQVVAHNGEKTLSISGPQSAIDAAKRMVSNIVEDTLNRDRGGSSMGGPGGPGPRPEMGATVDYPVAKDKVGVVIGKRGQTVNWIQGRSGAKIQVINEAPDGALEKIFKVTGSDAQIAYAKQLIDYVIQVESEGYTFEDYAGGQGGGQGGGTAGGQAHSGYRY